MRRLLLVLSVIFLVRAKNEDYKGYKVYNIKLETESQAERLNELRGDLIDFWKNPSLKHNVIGKAMVPPSQFDWFEERLASMNLKIDVYIEDVYEHLTKVENNFKRTMRNDDDRVFDFEGYYRYDEIVTHINALKEVVSDTNINIEIEEFGKTEQNRSVIYIKISNSTNSDEVRPVVIVEAGINPREWITIPAALNVVNRLLESDRDLLSKSDWIIVPVVNPDGYEYTHTNLRMWTKSRSTGSNMGFICPGVNINRNFDVDWLVSDSSSSPCSHLYAGVEPFSEIESQIVKHLIETYRDRIRLYVSLQNNGGFVSYPWQYERAATGMFRQHLLLALDMVAAMNEEYNVDVGWSAIGDRASGTGSDFAQKSGVLYSLNIDVVQRGEDGVNIPEEEIVDVIEDVWRAISVAATTLLSDD
ncbi:carboxypeptidase B-like [Pectinophora gossypiella]|uniref:carboxypeptidase B-like n=1 Tax=Pectinophora gossypiella TaxID=13191 RepID=UPI00214E23F7|nr:carboxypeptidase B-like [Pectinophora gossypiella]